MFYFSIKEDAFKTIKKEAKSSEREIIGVLIGKVYDNLLVIDQAVSGAQASGMTRVKLDNSTMAGIIGKIMSGDIQGNILGWYHSHPGFGVFMSPTDIGTQEVLQQFSKKVAALVIDPKSDEYEVFTLDSQSGVVQLSKDQIFTFREGEDGIPAELKELHEFSAKLDFSADDDRARLRYLIEAWSPYWPEKKCLICGTELKINESTNNWYCPRSKSILDSEALKTEGKVGELHVAGDGLNRSSKSKYQCKNCSVDLRFSKKLGAWYCRSCRRVFKHRVKTKEKDDSGETPPEKAEKVTDGPETEKVKAGSVDKKPGSAEGVVVEALGVQDNKDRDKNSVVKKHDDHTGKPGIPDDNKSSNKKGKINQKQSRRKRKKPINK